MGSPLKSLGWSAAVGLLALATGCGSAPVPHPRPAPAPTRTTAAPPRPSYDTPRKFAAFGPALPSDADGGRINIIGQANGPLPITLRGTTAYIATFKTLQVFDTSDGRTRAIVPPPDTVTRDPDANGDNPDLAPPALATAGGRSLVLTPFSVVVQGHGTTPGGTALDLVAVDTATNTTAWTVKTPLPSWAAPDDDSLATAVVGVDGDTAVVTVSNDSHAVTYAIALDPHTVLWSKPGFDAGALVGTEVTGTASAGGAHQRVLGRSLSDGEQDWAALDGYNMSVIPAGPAAVLVTGDNYDSGQGYAELRAGNTGRRIAGIPQVDTGETCTYAGASVTVCHDGTADASSDLAFDTATGRLLWQLPQHGSDRLAPQVTAVWHGAVYGTTSNGPVVLDARTGADRSDEPGIAPLVVDSYCGIALDKNADEPLRAYPAIG